MLYFFSIYLKIDNYPYREGRKNKRIIEGSKNIKNTIYKKET